MTGTSGPPRLSSEHAGAEADGGKERVLQRRLQRGVEGRRAASPSRGATRSSAATGKPPTTGAGML